MKLKYYSAFRNLQEELFLINIFSNAAEDSAATEFESIDITASSTPLKINYSRESIFDTMLTSTATLSVIASDYMQNIYSLNATDNFVQVLKNGAIYWQGYVTQNVYNQDFTNERFEFEIELIDSIATLKNIPFNSDEKSLSFLDYIKLAVKAIEETTINRIYIHDVLDIKDDNRKVVEVLNVHCSNYYDEENKPSSLYEVVRSIAQYLNLVVYLNGDSLYIFSPESDIDTFYYYEKSDDYHTANEIVIPFGNVINLISGSYSGSDNTLSINESYNTIVVTNSLYEVSAIYPDFDADGVFLIENEVNHKTRRIKRRYYDSDKFDTWKYKKNLQDVIYPTLDSITPITDVGAYVIKTVDFDTNEKLNSLNWETALQIKMSNDFRLPLGKKIMNKKVDVESFAKLGFYASLDFKARCSTTYTGYNSKVSTLGDSDTKGSIIVPIQIKCGDYYYNDVVKKWTTEATTIYIKCGDLKKSEEYTDNWFSCENFNSWENKTPDLNGFMIDMMKNNLDGELDIIFYTPYLWCWSSHGYNKPISEPYYRNNEIEYFYIKDIDVKFQIPSDYAYSGDSEPKDRIFEEVITESFTGSDFEIELLLSTNLNDSINKSTVIYSNKDGLKEHFKGFIVDDKEVIAEELIIKKHTQQFSKIRKVLNIVIRNNDFFNRYYDKFTNSNYVVLGYELDVRYNSNNINLTELHE